MACRYPGGVDSPEDLWQLVADGRDAISAFPDRPRLGPRRLYDPDPDQPGTHLHAARAASSTTPADSTPAFFGICPREALAIDPQQRLLLETSWEAFERRRASTRPRCAAAAPACSPASCTQDYGHALRQAPRRARGLPGHRQRRQRRLRPDRLHPRARGPGGHRRHRLLVLAGRHAPGLRRRCAAASATLALAGGVTVMATPGAVRRVQPAARAGRRRPLQGVRAPAPTAPAGPRAPACRAGAALRRPAQRPPGPRGDPRPAVNQDGASNGLTAPNGPSQQRVIRQALANAGLTTADVDAVEAHGTGTTPRRPDRGPGAAGHLRAGARGRARCGSGSVKSNIGHTQAAAGVAGVIKMVMAMRHGQLPPTLHVDEPSPHVDWTAGAVELLTEPEPWPDDGRPRRAGVSSFGVSGTNAHVILEEAARRSRRRRRRRHGSRPCVVPRATTPGLRAQAAQAARLAADTRPRPRGRRLHRWPPAARTTATAPWSSRTTASPARRAGRAVAGRPDERLLEATARAGRTVFVFPGQGSQWAGMAAELLRRRRSSRPRSRPARRALAPHVDWSLTRRAHRAPGTDPGPRRRRPARAVRRDGLAGRAAGAPTASQPDAVVGHSQGEIAAAYVAGALSLEDAARVVALRSQALARRSPASGGMVVGARRPTTTSRPLLPTDGVASPPSTARARVVVSGDGRGPRRPARRAARRGRPGATDPRRLRLALARRRARSRSACWPTSARSPPSTSHRSRSTPPSTGEPIDTAALDAEYWYRNLREPVRFADDDRGRCSTTARASSSRPARTRC